MKKVFIVMLIIIAFFVLYLDVQAVGSVNLSANKSTVEVGETFTISINLSGASVATLTTKLSYDTEKLQYVSGPANSNNVGSRVIYTWTDSTGGNNPLTGGTIATFTFKAKSAGKATFSVSGDFFSPDETSINPSFNNISVTVKSNVSEGNNAVSGGNNTASGGNNTVSGGNNIVSGGGNNTSGSNDIVSGVGNNTSGGNNIVSGGSNNTSGGNNTVSGENNNASGNNNISTGNNNASSGSNNTGNNNSGSNSNPSGSGQGTSSSGNINNKPSISDNNNTVENLSSNNYLKSLQLDVEGINPLFNKEIVEYYIVILETVTDININAEPEDNKASVQIVGNKNIGIGNSEIKVIVTAENGEIKEYTINVTKTNDLTLANANLENLAVENVTLNPEFSSDVTNYNIEIGANIDKLNILAVPQNVNAKVVVEGNENLPMGESVIKVIVIAEDGLTNKEYSILVNKIENTELLKDGNNEIITNIEQNTERNNYIFLYGIGFIVLIIILIFVIKKLKLDK